MFDQFILTFLYFNDVPHHFDAWYRRNMVFLGNFETYLVTFFTLAHNLKLFVSQGFKSSAIRYEIVHFIAKNWLIYDFFNFLRRRLHVAGTYESF